MAGEDFSSGLLYRLLLASLDRQGILAKLEAGIPEPDAANNPHVNLSAKRVLLAQAFEDFGASPIVQAGFDIQKMPDNPLSFAMIRTTSVDCVMDRFFKLQKYFHSKHRLQLLRREKNMVEMQHVSTTTEKPRIYEDLLLGGLMAGILSQYGCTNLRLDFNDKNIIKDGHVNTPFVPDPDSSIFIICWDDIIRPDIGQIEVETTKMGAFIATAKRTYSARIERCIAEDPIRKWSVARMAKEFCLSSRSLQRRLTEEGTSYRDCILAARCRCAIYYMTEESENLTAVGFLAGFSDAAHFSREFKKNMGLLPSNFKSTLSISAR